MGAVGVKTWVTSDIHIGHVNIRSYCPWSRGRFQDVEEMNEYIINYWNATVQPEDTIYVVGDLMMGHAEGMAKNIPRLSGKINLIIGNHDKRIVKTPVWHIHFNSIENYAEVSIDGTLVCMSHYPMRSWNNQYRGSIMLHGHLHSQFQPNPNERIFDVGIDGHPTFGFYDLNQLVTQLKHIAAPVVDHHGDAR